MAFTVMAAAVSCCLTISFLYCSSASRIIQPTLAKSTVIEGSSLKLVCVSNESMIWKSHGVPVEQVPGRIQVTVENSSGGAELLQSTLIISRVTPRDTGTYECGDVSDDNQLDIPRLDIKVAKAAKLKVENIAMNVTRSSPVVGGRVAVSVGDDLDLRCTGEARSHPSWKFNGELLKEGSDVHIADEQNRKANYSMSTLSVRKVTLTAAGRYQCVDAASHQSDSDEFTVVISSAANSAASVIVPALCVVLVAVSSTRFQ